ncbi:5072_t:CDS:2 [Acaulospora colombiana]|uniref:5072_t:CDS:1 n=1 Tax=Acaulospora colombiana TaxID=27376 RepID=A0ACA9M0M6_9GLOM|nr:5072_t:CDS:2 [Acaulospora colombiana]
MANESKCPSCIKPHLDTIHNRRMNQGQKQPPPQGNPAVPFPNESSIWEVYINESIVADNELVKDWTSSLNFLLAAIFSSVLSAFIIESKQMLQQDPADVMVDALIFFINNTANGTHTPYSRTSFSPAPYAVSVNCLFFASLSASIVAALASVVSLQWVAEYDAAVSRSGSSPEDRVKRRQFRTISCILSVALGYYAYTTHEKFHFTIVYLKSIEPILASANVAAKKVDEWIEDMANASAANNAGGNAASNVKETNFNKARLFLDGHELGGRGIILKRLFDAIAILNADLRRSFMLLDC